MSKIPETRPRNLFIAAPGDTGSGPPDLLLAPYACPPARLYAALRDVALAEPRTVLQSEAPEEFHMSFVQRTKFWRFPDDVVAQIEATEDGGAALTLSSKARYGVEDFGVNKRRVKRWLAALRERLKQPD
jgi:uncharacterized protein (DUF1499 family)